MAIRFEENNTTLHGKNDFKIIKNLINSLPDDSQMTINGKAVNAFSVFLNQSPLMIDFRQKDTTLNCLEHDRCENCKYEFTYPDLDQEPCLSCRQNHMDNWVSAN